MFNCVNEMQIRVTGDKMHQTDRNNVRAAIIAEVMEMLAANGVECAMVKEGLAVNVQHADLGAVNFVVDVKKKNLDYDYDFEVEDYQAEVKAKADKAEALAKAKAAKAARDKAERVAKAKARAAAAAEREKSE